MEIQGKKVVNTTQLQKELMRSLVQCKCSLKQNLFSIKTEFLKELPYLTAYKIYLNLIRYLKK